MRFLRFTLLQAYISSIQKNQKKALFVINLGIFLSIFAFSTAVISFFIEKKISDIQSDLVETQIDIRSMNNIISDFQTEINTFSKYLDKEKNILNEKLFIDEFDIFRKTTSTKDFFGPFIYHNLYELNKTVDETVKSLGVNMFDKNDPFYKENIIPYLETGWDETDIEYFVNTLNELHKNFRIISRVPFNNYSFNKEPLSINDLINEINDDFNNSLNKDSILFNDYYDTLDFLDSLIYWSEEMVNVFKAMKDGQDRSVKEYEAEIINYSELERNIIFSTFIFQFLIFTIIQIFEINSVNFNLIKTKNEKKIF